MRSPRKKQLAVLLLVALWLSGADLLVINTTPFLEWFEKAFKVLLYSVPVLSFGWIAFLWLGKTEDNAENRK
jgi:hypothetical protein